MIEIQQWHSQSSSNEEPITKQNNKRFAAALNRLHHPLNRLTAKGLGHWTDTGWQIGIDLLATYITTVQGGGRGRVWWDGRKNKFYQGQMVIRDLSPLEVALLRFFCQNPTVPHAKTDLIINAWPDELRQQGVSDESLYQVIAKLRAKIEPNRAKPRYIINWRGHPESGYRFFPEGRPEN